MLILVEGRDGSGKSTLCNELYNKGLSVIKVAKGRNYEFKELLQYALVHPLVCDRSFITEVVYRIFDGISCDVCLEFISSMLNGNTTVKIVYCKTEKDYENSMLRGETNIVKREDSERIGNIYDILMRFIDSTTYVKIMPYDWTVQNVNDVLDFINS